MTSVNNITEFCEELEKYWRTVDQEYVAFAKSKVVQLLDQHYRKGKPIAIVMDEILWYLNGAFPKQIENLKPMEVICQRVIASTKAT